MSDYENPEILNEILSEHLHKISVEYVLKYEIENSETIREDIKKKCKFLFFSSAWNFEKINLEVKKFHHSAFPNLLIFMLEVKDVEICNSRIEEFEQILKSLNELTEYRPLIVQITSSKRNFAKTYYKDEGSANFYYFLKDLKKPKSIDKFQNFFWFFVHEKIENYEDMMIEKLPKFENSSLILQFLNTLKLSDELRNKIIVKCAAEGTKNQLTAFVGSENITKIIPKLYKFSSPIPGLALSCLEQSIFLSAVENSNTNIIEYLTNECPLLIRNLEFDHQIKISDAALKSLNFELLCDLLEFHDFPFPDGFDKDSVENDRLQNIISNRAEFHKAVKKASINEICTLISKFNDRKIIYNTKNESALYQAVKIKNFNTYFHLKTTYGLETVETETEKMNSSLKTFSSKLIISEANMQSAVQSEEKIISLLIAKSSVNVPKIKKGDGKEYHVKVRKWYEQIYNTEYGKPLMIVVSSCDKLKVVFDFENEYTNKLDYMESDEGTIGISLADLKRILIGAKNSDDIQYERRIRGTIAHEFCHYAVYMVFKNWIKPYYNCRNKEIQILYQSVIRDIYRILLEQSKGDRCNDIIHFALTRYGEITEDSIPLGIEQELIVRVVEIMAYYCDDPDKIQELKSIYKVLFNFYENHVSFEFLKFNFENQQLVLDLNNKTGCIREIKNLMNLKNGKCIEFSVSKCLECMLDEKIIIVVTNIPKLFLYDVYKSIHPNGSECFESEYIIISAEQLKMTNRLESNKIKENLEDVLTPMPTIKVFIDCSKTTDINPVWQSFNQNANYIYIVENQGDFETLITKPKLKNASKYPINYTWNDFIDDTQVDLLRNCVQFQKSSGFSILELCLKKKGLEEEISNQDQQQDILFDVIKCMDEVILKKLIEGSKIIINANENITDKDYEILNHLRKFERKRENDQSEISEDSNKIFTLKELLNATLNNKYILIPDGAGTGKTWVMISIANAIMEYFPWKWVTLVDLKRYISIFKSESNRNENRQCRRIDFLSFMVSHMLDLKQNIDSVIFKQMYRNGRAVILFDGFDEIAPNYAEFVLQLAESFDHNGGNQLWIATRDYFEVNLKVILDIKVVYKLYKLSPDEGVDLISEVWAMNDLNKQNYKFETRDDFLEKFKEIDSENNYRKKARELVEKAIGLQNISIGQIQLYRMLADIGRSEDEFLIHKLSEYIIYDKCVDMQYERWCYEKGILRKDANTRIQKQDTTFMKFHLHQAMKIEVPEFANLCNKEDFQNEWTDEEIIGCGLLYKKDDKFFFIHRTFGEFFVADFVIRTLEKIITKVDVSEDAVSMIAKVIEDKKFNIIHMFINGELAEKQRINRFELALVKNKDIQETFYKISESFDIDDLINNEHKNLQSFVNLGKLVSMTFIKENYKKVKLTLFKKIEREINKNKPKSQQVNLESEGNTENIKKITQKFIEIAKSCFDLQVLEDIINNVEKSININLTKIVLKQKGIDFEYNDEFEAISQPNIIHAILTSNKINTENVSNNMKVFEKYLTAEEIMDMITETDKNGNNILIRLIANYNREQIITIWQTIEKIFASSNSSQLFREFIMSKKSNSNKTLLHYAAEHCAKIIAHQLLWELLQESFKEHNSKLLSFIIQTDNDGNTFIHNLVSYSKPEIIEHVIKTIKNNFGDCEILNTLGIRNIHGRNVLHHALYCQSIENIVYIFNSCNNLATNDNIKHMLENMDENNRNMLQSAVEFSKCLNVHEALWECIKKHLDNSEILKSINNFDNEGYNILHLAAKSNEKEIIKFIWNEIKRVLNNKEQNEYLRITRYDRSEEDLLTIAQDNNEHEDVKCWVENLINGQEMEVDED